jgi:hypothetical protein
MVILFLDDWKIRTLSGSTGLGTSAGREGVKKMSNVGKWRVR